jgi:hypothetical protein
MKLLKNGKNTLKAEITNISEHGFWVLLAEKEYFLPFDKYPWFKDAKVSAITNLEILHDHHLFWPDLDVDLTTEILENPQNYPLVYK